MPAPHKPPFAELIPAEKGGLPSTFSEPVRLAREHVTALVVGLRAQVEKERGDPHLNDDGKLARIREHTRVTMIDVGRAIDGAAATVKNLGGSAQQALSAKLYGNPNPAAVGAIQQTVLGFVSRDLAPVKLAHDGTGTATLGGSALLTLIGNTIDSVLLPQAGLVVQALAKLDPVALTAIGGEAVVAGARAALERRAADQDAEVAALLAVRKLGDTAAATVHGDRSTILKHIGEITGLPAVTLAALAPKTKAA